jgi:hypothetical protein
VVDALIGCLTEDILTQDDYELWFIIIGEWRNQELSSLVIEYILTNWPNLINVQVNNKTSWSLLINLNKVIKQSYRKMLSMSSVD